MVTDRFTVPCRSRPCRADRGFRPARRSDPYIRGAQYLVVLNATAYLRRLAVRGMAPAAADPLPPPRWLLDQFDGSIALTQTGNLSRKLVQDNADRFGWDFSHPPRTEDADSMPDREIRATVGQVAAEEGFRESRTGEPPDEHDVSRAIHATSNLCQALGLLASDGDWRDLRQAPPQISEDFR